MAFYRVSLSGSSVSIDLIVVVDRDSTHPRPVFNNVLARESSDFEVIQIC